MVGWFTTLAIVGRLSEALVHETFSYQLTETNALHLIISLTVRVNMTPWLLLLIFIGRLILGSSRLATVSRSWNYHSLSKFSFINLSLPVLFNPLTTQRHYLSKSCLLARGRRSPSFFA